MRKKVAIIGSGIGGIASAIRLAAKGYQIEVFEQSSKAGGKISEFSMDGFRFDTGPSLLTYPNLINELFLLFGDNPKDYFNCNAIDASCKYFWEDGTIVNAWQEPNLFANELEKNTGAKLECVLEYLVEAEKLYSIAGNTFVFNSLNKLSNYTSAPFLKTFLNFPRLDPFRTLHQRNLSKLKNPKAVQIFDRYATYNGSNPYQSPSALRMISHLEHNMGVYFPSRGIYSIVSSLYDYAKSKGVQFHFNSRVEKIYTAGRSVKGIRVNAEDYQYDIIVSNIDVITLYSLLDAQRLPSNQSKQQRSSSAIIFYWGVGNTYTDLKLHNILFSDKYQNEFDHLFLWKTISPDPTVYIYISSKMIPGDAPPGCENWYVMINAPENIGQYNQNLIDEAKNRIIEKINRTLKIDISQHILSEKVADPRSIEDETGSFRGSLYGLSSNNILAAFNRHPNFSRKVENLFFVGGSVHPGGGIPLCLASAKIADSMLPTIK